MKELDISWYVISTGYEDRLCMTHDDDGNLVDMDYEQQCQKIKELNFPTGEYIVLCNLNYAALSVNIEYSNDSDNKNFDFDSIDPSDLPAEIREYINNHYEEETGLLFSKSIPNEIPYCATFGIANTTLYKTNSGHYLLQLVYDSESG